MIYRHQSVHTDLVLSVLCQVLHPRGSLVPASIHNLQVAHLETRNCKEGDFKVDVNGLLLVEISFWGLNSRQFEIGTQHVLSES